MIKITSFYPFRNFLRITQEFREDKALVFTKSLTFENDFEFHYEEVGEISDGFYTNGSQMDFSYGLLVFTAFTMALFGNFIYSHSVLLRIEQALIVAGLILYIMGFKKIWIINIWDKDDKLLTSIKRTSHNHDAIPQIIEMIKSKSEDTRVITATNPFPDEKPLFEHINYDLPKLKMTTDRFYENEIVGFEKSIFEESVYSIRYIQLNGKVYRGKSSNDIGGTVFTIAILFSSIIIGLDLGFRVNFGSKGLYLIYTLGVFFLLSLPLNLVKREVIGLYGMNGDIAYWTYLNRKNKDLVENIIEVLQSKIPMKEKSGSS